MAHNFLKKELDLLDYVIGVDQTILDGEFFYIDLKQLKMVPMDFVVFMEESIDPGDVVLGKDLRW